MSQLFYYALTVPAIKQLDHYVSDAFYKTRLQKSGYNQNYPSKISLSEDQTFIDHDNHSLE